jgi:hypothetical protein
MMHSHGPQLRFYMNLKALDALPDSSAGPRTGAFQERISRIRQAGFEGVQFDTPGTRDELNQCANLGLGIAAGARINTPEESSSVAERLAGDGYECATLHVGWGLEDDDEATRLIASVIEASDRWRIPLYIETHRATIFQDMWRTVQFVKRFPEVLVNGDFSHWYTGQEMVYGGFEKKFAFIQPVLERVRFLHGRIGNPGCIQVRIDDRANEQPTYIRHFEQLWTASFREFLRSAPNDASICFTPELLGPHIYYARTLITEAGPAEESDRWEQSLLLNRIAGQCFEKARADLSEHRA